MSQEEIITKVKEAVQADPNKDYIQSIYLFGSFLHGDAKKDSDVDLLYETRKTMSLFEVGGMCHRLENKLGRKVDFVPRGRVIKQLKEKILLEAIKIYERK
jgi:predicted nucleotidyltransferase